MRSISIDQDPFIHDVDNQHYVILRSDQIDENTNYLESVVLPTLTAHEKAYTPCSPYQKSFASTYSFNESIRK
jgi:hypothetical protein